MLSVVSVRPAQPDQGIQAAATPAHGPALVPLAIAAAWLIAIVAQATGNAALLHHHALIENGPPLWVGVPLFLLGWQVMIAAMMLPASLPSIGRFSARMADRARPNSALAAFIGSYALVLTAFGLLAFLGDVVVHHAVDATPWLAARPWLVEAGVVGLAGAYQLVPLKRRSQAACRHPAAPAPRTASRLPSPFQLGLDHGLACLGSSWALMLLVFAEGFANLWWMAALTAVMVYETSGRHGQRVARVGGVLLFVFGALVVSSGRVA
jgi:predicted metal-binding membrane protein